MSENYISPLESFHNTFAYFIQELNMLTWDAAKQWQWVGVSWAAGELQYEVRNDGESVLRNAGSFLAESERAKITSLLNKISSLPSDALCANENALNHPQWDGLRHDAHDLLKHLARPIAENRAFLNDGKTSATMPPGA